MDGPGLTSVAPQATPELATGSAESPTRPTAITTPNAMPAIMARSGKMRKLRICRVDICSGHIWAGIISSQRRLRNQHCGG